MSSAKSSNPAYKGAAQATALIIRRVETKSMWDLATETPLNTQINTMRKQSRTTYMGDWGGRNYVEQWPEMKSFVVDAAVAVAAPLAIEAPDFENSSSGEERYVTARSRSHEIEPPSDGVPSP